MKAYFKTSLPPDLPSHGILSRADVARQLKTLMLDDLELFSDSVEDAVRHIIIKAMGGNEHIRKFIIANCTLGQGQFSFSCIEMRSNVHVLTQHRRVH